MAQYSNLKAYIEEKIYENGTQAITGDILQDVLKVMTDDLGEFYQMGGVASPSTDPGTPDAKVIYIATEAGTYTNFGGITLAAGEVALLIFETSWTKETLNVLSSANGGVKTANLADGAVTTEKIAGGAVETAKIANNAVTSGKVADGAIGTAKIADGAIAADKIAANAVESAKIKNGAVTEGKINDGAVTAGKVAANAVTTAKIADEAVTTAKLNDGAVTEDKIATDAVTSGKVKDGAIGTAKIAAGAVTHAKIGAGAVEESNIKDGAVTSDKIANGAVGSDQLAEGAFSAQNLADGSVTTDKLADDAVTAEKIADGAVTADKFANGSVTTIKLGSGAVTTEKIGDGMVTRQKLADSSVGTSKIIDGAVTTDKVADGAITDAKLENPVSVSQNSQTGKTELLIGNNPALIVDNEPEADSNNLVKSGGVYKMRILQNTINGAKLLANKAWNGLTGKLIDYNNYSASEVYLYNPSGVIEINGNNTIGAYKTVYWDKDFNFLGETTGYDPTTAYSGAYYVAFTYSTVINSILYYRSPITEDATTLSEVLKEMVGAGNQRLSVLGDSISTYDGVSPSDYNPYYPAGDVQNVKSMYWSLLSQKLGYVIDTINACGSSCVVTSQSDQPSFLERYDELGTPDIVIIQGGTNDSHRNLSIGTLDFTKSASELDTNTFAGAYDKLIRLVQQGYPSAKIITMTNHVMGDTYNDVIWKVSSYHKVFACVDVNYTTFSDGNLHIHPDTEGMNVIAASFVNGLANGKSLLGVSYDLLYNESIDLNSKIDAIKLYKSGQKPLSSNNEINEQFIELYLIGDTVASSNIYKLMNIYIDLPRYRLAFNITDENNNIICYYDNDGILNPSNKDARNNVLILEEKNDSGVSGFAVVDFNKITSKTYNEILNSDRLTTLSVNPIIKGYLEDIKVSGRVGKIEETYKCSLNSDLLNSLISELYIYKKDGTEIDEQTVFGLGNIYVSGDRRAINLTIKDGSTVTWILDADSGRGEDLTGPVIELKEKNNSGYAGYVVMRGDIFSITETIGENYSFNNDRILLKNNNPIIASVLEDIHPDPSQDEINKRKEINSRLISCVKSTVSDEIAKAKQGTYVDANAQGFLPSNTAAQNVSAMNTLLSAGGTIIVEQPGNYLVNDSMLLHSNTTLLFAPGVVIKMASDMPYVFINQAAFNFATSGYDDNIKVVGYHLDTDGYTCYGGVYGLRGFLTFFHAKNIYISDVECYYYKAHWFFMHLCDWENIEICNVQAFGDKDTLHIGRGKNLFIHNCAICAVDDTIALNAWDFVESNPETGNIENVRIDNIIELPHYFNTSSAYDYTLGFSIRMLNGCWLNWSSGTTVQHSTRVVYDGKLYRCTNLQGTTATSNTAPDAAPGSVNVDGILWSVETSPAVLGVCVKNVYVSNYTTYQHKLEGSFCLSNGINEVDHKSWVQGATWIPNENIHFKNIECLAETPAPFLIQEDINDVVVTNSIFENAKFSKGLIYFKDVFGLPSSSFTTPDMELVNNLHILGDNGQYKLSAVNVSGRRDSINIYTTKEQYSQVVVSTSKTDNTTIEEIEKVYVV